MHGERNASALNVDPIRAVAEEWRRDASRFRQYGDERGARTCELHAAELESVVRDHLMEAITVAEACDESGYSESRLRALLAEGKLTNVGREGAPRIRRTDLPAKPTAAESSNVSLADQALAARNRR